MFFLLIAKTCSNNLAKKRLIVNYKNEYLIVIISFTIELVEPLFRITLRVLKVFYILFEKKN